MFLAILATLGISYATFTNNSLLKANNLVGAQGAQLEAESGMAFMSLILSNCEIPPGSSGQQLLDDAANALDSALNGTGNLQGQTIGYNGTTVTIPSVFAGNGRSFSAQLSLVDTLLVHLAVTGQNGEITRSVGIDYQMVPGGESFFAYGIASMSPVSLTGNAKVLGANSPSEAQVLSATESVDEALKMSGNSEIEGDVYFSNPLGYATLNGNASIGGEPCGSETIAHHIHNDIGSVDFPEVDPSIFEPFATNIVDSETPTSGNLTFNNIRILAGTNPTFSGNINVNGVIFIEAPNQVHFTGNFTFKGVIVTEDAGENVYDQNTIKFSGNTDIEGVEVLPDTPEFHDLREMPGSFLLAPGFGTEFTGNFGTINGTMAADEFKFTGNAGGTVKGSIINYGDSEFRMTGNSHLIIDRSGTPTIPSGFATWSNFGAIPDSYMEY
jgi:hypothetical protein